MTVAVSDSPISASWHYLWYSDAQSSELDPQLCQMCLMWFSVCVTKTFPLGISFILQLCGHIKYKCIGPIMFLWLYSFKVNFSTPTPTTLRWLRAHTGWFLTSLPLVLTFTLSLKCRSKLKQLDYSHQNSAFLFFLSSLPLLFLKNSCEDGNSIYGMDMVLDMAGQVSALTRKGLLEKSSFERGRAEGDSCSPN